MCIPIFPPASSGYLYTTGSCVDVLHVDNGDIPAVTKFGEEPGHGRRLASLGHAAAPEAHASPATNMIVAGGGIRTSPSLRQYHEAD